MLVNDVGPCLRAVQKPGLVFGDGRDAKTRDPIFEAGAVVPDHLGNDVELDGWGLQVRGIAAACVVALLQVRHRGQAQHEREVVILVVVD